MSSTLPARRSGLQSFFGGSSLMPLREEFDDLFSRSFANWNGGTSLPEFLPAVDLTESDTALCAYLDLPGMKPGEVEIEVADNRLLITGERKEAEEEKGRTYHVAERAMGRFARSLELPCPVDAEKVEAVFHDGVLTVTLPKAETAKTRKVAIKAV